MTPLQIMLWVILLVAQNAAFTWTSRARNSGSDWYHATAAVFSNGVWFAAFFYTFAGIEIIRETGDTLTAVGLGALYIAATVVGSVTSGWFLRTYVETGKRRVGHYDKLTNALLGTQAAVETMGQATGIHTTQIRELEARLQELEIGAGPTAPAGGLQEYIRDREARDRRYS